MWWWLWLACHATPTPDDDSDVLVADCSQGPATVEVGARRASDVFTPFEPDEAVRLGEGPQHGGAWHLTWGARVSGVDQALRTEATLVDVDTGVELALSRVPETRALFAVPDPADLPWACAGVVPDGNLELDARGLDDDDTVPVWQEVCGRRATLHVSLRDAANTVILAEDTVTVVLRPPEDEGDVCP